MHFKRYRTRTQTYTQLVSIRCKGEHASAQMHEHRTHMHHSLSFCNCSGQKLPSFRSFESDRSDAMCVDAAAVCLFLVSLLPNECAPAIRKSWARFRFGLICTRNRIALTSLCVYFTHSEKEEKGRIRIF